MKPPTKFDMFLNWLDSLFKRYDCKKGRHRWGYLLSESGRVYMDESEVPEELWKCLECYCSKNRKLSPAPFPSMLVIFKD